MKKVFVPLVLFILLALEAAGQQQDTVVLGEVAVYGMPSSRYSAGTKVNQIQSGNESDLLTKAMQDETTAYFKTYGNNQLSTISFRGTSASHTAILWNGININSPTLGQTDFSLLPTFLLEDIAVQYGTSSSLYGSDALGGSVILAQTAPAFQREWKIQATQQAGSFGRLFTGVKGVYGNGRLELRTKAYAFRIQNDFPYTAPQVGYRKRQNDASVNNHGFDQQVHFKINDRQQLSAEGMYTYNFRNIQPTVTHESPDGTLKDDNARFSLNYRNDSRIGMVYATAGYVRNQEHFNDSSTTRSDQVNVLVNVDKEVSSKIRFRYGASAAHFSANTDSYGKTVTENRYDGFISYRQLIIPRWTASVNLRQSVYAHQQAPFAPSLGSEFRIVSTEVHKLLVRAQVSRGYRVPTLNDRYWIPGGNPDLKPEDARHAEAGIAWTSKREQRAFTFDVTAFKTWVDEWIIWLPGSSGIWAPSNLQKVNAYGMEMSAAYSISGKVLRWQTGLHYGYTRSVNQKGLNDFDVSSIGKQLPYVPFHVASVFIKPAYKAWRAQLRAQYTGLRYTTLDNTAGQSLDPYVLLDVSLGRNFELSGWAFSLKGDVNNIINTYYENNAGYAMPGRNYAINLLVTIKNKTRL